MDLYGVIGTKGYANLLSDPQDADVIAVAMLPGKGEIKAGTVLKQNSSTLLWEPAASADIATTSMLAVLKEDVDTGAPDSTIAIDAAAYRTGRFIDGAVKYDNSGTLTDLTHAHKVVLRQQGIVFKAKEGTGTIDNGTVFKVKYVANNGAEPAEADYVVFEVKGATHTVLANTVTGFTAPAGKTFSKWNTAADGTGTDKAAAATITVSADVTLYAVWAS